MHIGNYLTKMELILARCLGPIQGRNTLIQFGRINVENSMKRLRIYIMISPYPIVAFLTHICQRIQAIPYLLRYKRIQIHQQTKSLNFFLNTHFLFQLYQLIEDGPLSQISLILNLVIEIIFLSRKAGMGAVKSITHSFTSNEYLLWYIQKNDLTKVNELLTSKPHLVNENLSVNYKTTPLHRAATNGNLELVKLLVQKYTADVDLRTSAGETALVGSTKRNRLQIIQYLLSKGANPGIVSNCGLTALDYAVLQGLYEPAILLYEAVQALKQPQQYSELGKQYKYRFVNYEMFLDALKKKIQPENAPNFLAKQRKVLEDPIVDPRESWKDWLVRNIEFRDPPMIERGELPEQLQPQNQKFATLRHFLTKWTLSPLAQSVSLKPRSQSQALSECKMVKQERQSAYLETVQIRCS